MVVDRKVYITRKIPQPGLSILSNACTITLNNKATAPSRKEILKKIRGKDGLLCMLSDKIDEGVIDAASDLKVISSYSTGFEHIDTKKATEKGIYVLCTADILAEATADLTFALMLACARNIVNADKYVRENKWTGGWAPDLMLGFNVYGRTLGIIGLGKIGMAVARRARGFNMHVLYHNRNRNAQAESELGVRYSSLDELLEESDFVSMHTTLNKCSYHIIDFSKLRIMKKTAFLINTARGQVVNEADLVRALKGKIIAGAALDVFEKEPPPQTSPLLKMKNVVVLPHIGSATYQTRSKMSEIAAKNLIDILNGKEPDPKFLVNPEVKVIRPL